MTQPTHTHRSNGGKFKESAQQMGGGALEGQLLVLYHVHKGIASITTRLTGARTGGPSSRRLHDLHILTGHDHIKGNKDKPVPTLLRPGQVQKTVRPRQICGSYPMWLTESSSSSKMSLRICAKWLPTLA